MSNRNSRYKASEALIELHVLIGDYNVVLNVPKQTKIGDVINMIRSYEKLHHQYGPLDSRFIGLASVDHNQFIDYWLMNHSFNFSRFKNKLLMRALYSNMDRPDKISVNQFEFIKCLGEGACGAVYLARSRITGELFAMKRLNKSQLTHEDHFKSVFREQKILRTLPRSNHTVKFHASFQSLDHFNFLLDYYPGGELFVHLRTKLSEQDAKVYFCQILSAIEFLHRNNILYRDLKPQNILVDAFGHLCIADFGLSKCGFRQQDITNTHCGSPDYMAPQVLENKDYNFSSDFYSIGAILYEFITGFPPYYSDKTNREEQHQGLQDRLEKMKSMQLNLEFITKDKSLRNLIKGLLHPDPQLRITDFHIIKNSPWLSDIDWKAIDDRSLEVPFKPSLYKNYICEEFRDQRRREIVQKLNQFEIEKFESFQFFDYICPQSEKLLFGRTISMHGKQMTKKKHSGINRDKSKAKLKSANNQTKGNISIALYQKQIHQYRESRDDTATTSNSNASAREMKSHKITQPKENMHHFMKKQSSRKNILKKVPSSHKIVTAPSSHNVSQCSNRRIGTSKDKGLTLKTKNDLNKSKLALGSTSTPMHKSKSKDKSHKVLGLGMKKEQAYMSNKSKKQILPVSSYKIKLM